MTPVDYRPRFLVALKAHKQALGRPLRHDEILDVAHLTAEILIGEAVKEAKKERKKSGIDERAGAILNVYPRREGGQSALVAISKALERDGFERVLERTTEYANAVARWSPARKRAQSGQSLIPLPATWFGNSRYNDDEAAWWEGTGGKSKAEKPHQLPEPEGWRFAHPESRYVTDNEPWDRIDLITQQWIINNTPKKENTA